jgi:hypothetical protein
MYVCVYYIYTHTYAYVYSGYMKRLPVWARWKRVGAHSSFSEGKFPKLAGTSPLNSGFWSRRLPEHASVRGRAGGRIRRAAAADAQSGDPRRASHVAERCWDGPAQASVREHHRAAAARRRAVLGAAPREGAVRARAARAVALERHAVGGCSPTGNSRVSKSSLRVHHLDAQIGAEGVLCACQM